MSQITIWHGLEREVRAAGNVRPFSKAQERHPALRDYATLAEVIAGVSPKDERHRNTVLAALLAESLDGRGAVWASALALALRPMLLGLVKGAAARAEGERFDKYVGRVRGLGQPDWRERARVYRAVGDKEGRAEELAILCERVVQIA